VKTDRYTDKEIGELRDRINILPGLFFYDDGDWEVLIDELYAIVKHDRPAKKPPEHPTFVLNTDGSIRFFDKTTMGADIV